MQNSLSTFLVLCFLLTITPGADTALVLRSSMGGGRKLFVATICGICVGLLFHATMSSLGLSAVLQKSAKMYSIIKILGAGYLIYLGIRGLYEAWRMGQRTQNVSKSPGLDRQGLTSSLTEFRNGLLTNVLNPKVAVFYLTFLPQFVDIQKNVFLQSVGLSLIHIAMSFIWLYLIGQFVTYFKDQLAKLAVRRSVETATGLALLAFGIRLASSASTS